MKITFQTASGEKYEMDVDAEMTIGDAKKKIEEMMNEDTRIKAQDQRYIFAGKILGDDDKFKSVENLKDGSCIFLMGKGKSKSQEKKETPAQTNQQPNYQPPHTPQEAYGGGQGFPTDGSGMPGDMFGAGLQQSFEYLSNNPQMIDMLYGQLMVNMTEEQKEDLRKKVLAQLKEFQRDPRAFQQVMDYARNMSPATINQAMAGMPMMGQGFPQMQNQQYTPSPTVPCSHGFYPPFHQPLYNYFPQQSQISSPNLEKVYETELKTLHEMGYSNHELNLEALKRSNGNISRAIQFLIDWSNN
jgi:ubiquilin